MYDPHALHTYIYRVEAKVLMVCSTRILCNFEMTKMMGEKNAYIPTYTGEHCVWPLIEKCLYDH